MRENTCLEAAVMLLLLRTNVIKCLRLAVYPSISAVELIIGTIKFTLLYITNSKRDPSIWPWHFINRNVQIFQLPKQKLSESSLLALDGRLSACWNTIQQQRTWQKDRVQASCRNWHLAVSSAPPLLQADRARGAADNRFMSLRGLAEEGRADENTELFLPPYNLLQIFRLLRLLSGPGWWAGDQKTLVSKHFEVLRWAIGDKTLGDYLTTIARKSLCNCLA